MTDPVNHPAHYTSSPATCSKCGHPIECIDITRHMGFDLGNAVKYIWRADLKNDAIEDLKKAAWYINDEIARREKSRPKDVISISTVPSVACLTPTTNPFYIGKP